MLLEFPNGFLDLDRTNWAWWNTHSERGLPYGVSQKSSSRRYGLRGRSIAIQVPGFVERDVRGRPGAALHALRPEGLQPIGDDELRGPLADDAGRGTPVRALLPSA